MEKPVKKCIIAKPLIQLPIIQLKIYILHAFDWLTFCVQQVASNFLSIRLVKLSKLSQSKLRVIGKIPWRKLLVELNILISHFTVPKSAASKKKDSIKFTINDSILNKMKQDRCHQ